MSVSTDALSDRVECVGSAVDGALGNAFGELGFVGAHVAEISFRQAVPLLVEDLRLNVDVAFVDVASLLTSFERLIADARNRDRCNDAKDGHNSEQLK